MTFERRDSLTVQYATHHYSLGDAEKDAFDDDLLGLARVVENFPASSLHVEVARHPRSGDCEVKLNLSLAKQNDFFAREQGQGARTLFKQGVQNLIEQVLAWERRRSERTERDAIRYEEIPTRFVRAPVEPDLERLQQTSSAGDWAGFRDAIGIYRESLRLRIGRRIELQPHALAMLHTRFSIDDCVEAVFASAFEGFGRRGKGAPIGLGEWLEARIDGAIRDLANDPDEVTKNLDYLRSSREAGGSGANA